MGIRTAILAAWAAAVAWAQTAPPRPAEVKAEDKCVVEGSVLNAKTGEPVRKAQVTLFKMDADSYTPYAALTDPAGHFRVAGLDPGRYRLSVFRSGYARPEMERRQGGQAASTIALAARQNLKDLVYKLTPAAVISGRVIDEDGDPVTSAQVQALRYRYLAGRRQLAPSGYASTDDQGHYRMHSLPPGRYVLKVSHPEQRALMGFMSPDSTAADQAYAPLYYPGVLEPSEAVPVQVAAGEERRGADFRLLLVPTVRVRGRVLNAPGPRGRGTMVSLAPRQTVGGDQAVSSVKPDGAFELRGVVPGSYVLMAHYGGRERLSARRVLEVGNANLDNLELTLKPGVEVAGQVSVEGKVALEGLRVGVSRDGLAAGMRDQAMSQVASDGSFRLTEVAEGDYRLAVYSLPASTYVKAARLGGADVLDNPLTVGEAGLAGKLELVLSDAAGKVDGSVVDDKGEAAGGATVALLPEGKPNRPDLIQSTQADQLGRYGFKAVAPGDYVLYAWEEVEPGAWQDPGFLEAYKDKGKKVTVGERAQQKADLTAAAAGQS